MLPLLPHPRARTRGRLRRPAAPYGPPASQAHHDPGESTLRPRPVLAAA
ncbi:hypothetical protein GA0115245_12921, partial [Streptomyces sp. di188]